MRKLTYSQILMIISYVDRLRRAGFTPPEDMTVARLRSGTPEQIAAYAVTLFDAQDFWGTVPETLKGRGAPAQKSTVLACLQIIANGRR